MEFIVDKTSIWDDGKPCEEAYHRTLTKIDGDVKEKRSVWVINIDTFKQLLAFQEKYRQVVVATSPCDKTKYEELTRYIEIYDDYRE